MATAQVVKAEVTRRTTHDLAGRFLDAIATRLTPACDRSVVQAAFDAASSGWGPVRTADGRRTSGITPSGMPLEASVSVPVSGSVAGGAGFRYLTETATAAPFFVPRLAAQCEAIDRLLDLMPTAAQTQRPAIHSFVDELFPDPAAVPARSRFAFWFGITHHPAVPAQPAGLKIYGNGVFTPRRLDVAPAFGLRGSSYEIDATGAAKHKHYWRADTAVSPDDVITLAKRYDVAGADQVIDSLGAVIGPAGWDGRLFISSTADQLALHVRTKAWRLDDHAHVIDAVLRLAEKSGVAPEPVSSLFQAMDAASAPWQCTVIGFALGRGGLAKVNVYAAPVAQ